MEKSAINNAKQVSSQNVVSYTEVFRVIEELKVWNNYI
jgi:hypothetical protein